MTRIAMYSHDTYGLGHLRRTLELARGVQQHIPGTDIRIVTGSPRARSFPIPPNVEVIRLPAVTKDASGHYVSKDSDAPLEETVRARKQHIREAVLGYRPDFFVVDHSPLGLRGELLPLLGDLRHRTGTRLILGLRDILDDPSRVVRDWRDHGVYRLLESIYHHVWVYGAREVFALDELYGIPPEVAARMEYLGYLGREKATGEVAHASTSFPDSHRPHLLCLVGGGGDGYPLATAFLRMLAEHPDRWNGTLVTGPFLSRGKRQRVAERAAGLSHVQLLRFAPEIRPLMQGSDAVVTMGGYNAMIESLSLGRRTLVVPRTFPRREQWLRANAFERLGLLKTVHPDDLDDDTLSRRTVELLESPAPSSPESVGLPWSGTQRFAHHIHQLIQHSQESIHHEREELRRA